MDEVIAGLERKGVFVRKVKVPVAAHSPQVDPLRPACGKPWQVCLLNRNLCRYIPQWMVAAWMGRNWMHPIGSGIYANRCCSLQRPSSF
jgi:hypothetical protein